MKIGLLTLPLRHNYGGILQAYALQRVLQKMGHDAMHIRLRPIVPSLFDRAKIFVKNRLRTKADRIVLLSELQKDDILYKDMIRFIEERISPISRFVNTKQDLESLNAEYRFDSYCVGSDQVWRQAYAKHHLPRFFLDFAPPNVSCFSYAASFGTENLTYSANELRLLSGYLKRFSAVSVREFSGVDICRKKLNVDANLVLDPTLLLSKSEYLNLIKSSDTGKEKLCFEYFLDHSLEKKQFATRICRQMNMKKFSIDVADERANTSIDMKRKPSVEMWLESFEKASYVVTDSFHGCVFAIIFNKPFAVFGNRDRGMERFNTLLQHFGLESRMSVTGDGELGCEIDWCDVEKKKQKMVLESLSFLNMISGEAR